MFHFFQVLRDECHDFLIQCRQSEESNKQKKMQKIAKKASPQRNENVLEDSLKDTIEKKEVLVRKKSIFRNKQPITNNPNKVKRPTPSFIYFLRDNHQIYQQKYPNLNFAEIRKIVSKEWSELSREFQEPFLKKAEIDRKRYQQDLEKIGLRPEQMKKKKTMKLNEEENNEDLKSISISGSLLDTDQ